MKLLLRFFVVQVLLLWQGGFVFYAAVVVPTGTHLLGAEGQGAITARVTDWLNAIGLVGVGALALELTSTRDPNTRRTAYRWRAWVAALACQLLLLYLHMRLDALLDGERMHLIDRAGFYPLHQAYLWTSIVQWLTCLLLAWWALRAWKSEDGERPA